MAVRYGTGLNWRALFPPWFWIILALALINRYVIRYQIASWVDHYLNDLMAMPLMLHLSSLILGLYIGKLPYRINKTQIILATFLTATVFELVLPASSSRYTADWIDVGMYASGSFLYFLLQKTS